MTPGTLIAGKYRLRRLLGEGAMGVVWAAINERTEREVALKLINGENDTLRRRLLREARATGRLAHRNIIEILDVGETEGGEPFLVMPLLAGETLADRLKRDGLLSQPLAARIAADIARGLEAAHAAGIVHRDLKPANVFLHREPGGDDDFVVKVLDFGVSKILGPHESMAATMTGNTVGSPLYMSPEQAIADANVGPRADVWALGVLLFEMLTGTRPFYASTAFAVVAKILRGPIPTVLERAPGVDPALGAVVARCLVRRPVDRLASATQLCALLEPFAGAREHPAPSAPLPEPTFDEDEPTEFFKKPASARADEMMAAAEALARPEVFSSGEVVSSTEVLSSADVLASAPLTMGETQRLSPQAPGAGPGTLAPEDPDARAGAVPAEDDPSSSTTPLIQPSDAPGEEADDPPEPWARGPRRTGLWIGVCAVAALAIVALLYLGASPAPAPARGAAAGPSAETTSEPRPRDPPRPTVVAAAEAPSPAPSSPPVEPPALAARSSAAPSQPPGGKLAPVTRTAPVGPARAPSTTAPRSGGKIIRETPF